jgi:hypothetical protein
VKIISEWRQAWRMFSLQAAVLLVAWSVLPPHAQAAILQFLRLTPDEATACIGVGIIVGRLIDQPSVRR